MFVDDACRILARRKTLHAFHVLGNLAISYNSADRTLLLWTALDCLDLFSSANVNAQDVGAAGGWWVLGYDLENEKKSLPEGCVPSPLLLSLPIVILRC